MRNGTNSSGVDFVFTPNMVASHPNMRARSLIEFKYFCVSVGGIESRAVICVYCVDNKINDKYLRFFSYNKLSVFLNNSPFCNNVSPFLYQIEPFMCCI